MTLGNSGPDQEFDVLRRSGALVDSSLNLTDSLLLKILSKILENILSFSPIRIGEHRHKFIGVLASGEPEYGYILSPASMNLLEDIGILFQSRNFFFLFPNFHIHAGGFSPDYAKMMNP